jgi:capsid protein
MLKFFQNIFRSTPAKLSYDAVDFHARNRRVRRTSSLSEDKELRPHQRQLMLSESRDLLRNFTLAGFVIRKHLQFVADFDFESVCEPEATATAERKAEIEAFNVRFERKMTRWMRRDNCDVASRHCFSEMLELIETHRVLDGDVGILRTKGGQLQIIEGDRIRNPVDPSWENVTMLLPDYEWIHGLKIGRTGRTFRYAICRRLPEGGFEFEREVAAENLFLSGYFTRADQVRGVSKLAPAITYFAHLYEGIDYALGKAKLSQLLGLFSTHGEDDFEADENGVSAIDEMANQFYDKFGPEIAHVTGKRGDTLQMVAANTPSNEFQTFCIMTIRLVFAALDIPYSFFDGSAANYYGQKGELDNYVDSCRKKQTDLLEFLSETTEWLVNGWWLNGELELPTGYTPQDIEFEWAGASLPSWRLIDDAHGYATAIMSGLDSPKRIARAHKRNVWQNVKDLHDVLEEARRLGLNLSIDPKSVFANV